MKPNLPLHSRFQTGKSLGMLITALCLLTHVPLSAEDSKSKIAQPAPKKADQRPQKKFTGADLYALHCNRCHPERYASERTPEQWKTILLHMRTRANIPAAQARAILEFLQEDSGK